MKRTPLILRWDLDKTYLVSNFESLRSLIRVPFEKAKDKVALPGVAALIKGVRRTAEAAGRKVAVYFLSASPPQIGAAIREKLELDGIAHDGITFKDQVRHLMYARFDAVLEQIGYKLERLLSSATESPPGAVEILFGDDWESDPFVYSLYADVLEGRVSDDDLAELLRRAGVSRHYSERIAELVAAEPPHVRVRAIFILRQRPARAADLQAFGPRLVWFDNYFECALKLWILGLLDKQGVVDVVRDVAFNPQQAAVAFEAVCQRGANDRAALAPVGRMLTKLGLMEAVGAAPLGHRISAALLRRFAPARLTADGSRVVEYAQLVERWSLRGRKEAIHDDAKVDSRADDAP